MPGRSWPTTEDAKRICEEKGLDGVIVIGVRTKEGADDTIGGSTHGKDDKMKDGMLMALDSIYEFWGEVAKLKKP